MANNRATWFGLVKQNWEPFFEVMLGFRGPNSSACVCSMQGPQGHEKTPVGQAPIDILPADNF
jgi:hypothetical protein